MVRHSLNLLGFCSASIDDQKSRLDWLMWKSPQADTPLKTIRQNKHMIMYRLYSICHVPNQVWKLPWVLCSTPRTSWLYPKYPCNLSHLQLFRLPLDAHGQSIPADFRGCQCFFLFAIIHLWNRMLTKKCGSYLGGAGGVMYGYNNGWS